MDINQVEAFLSVIELGSFSAAANFLGVAQPTISARISSLETHVGQKLFHRTHHPLRPTQKAMEIQPFAQQMLDAAEAFGRCRKKSGGTNAVSVRVGTHSSVVSTIVPSLMREFSARFPVLDLDFEIGTSYILRDKLNRGSVDFCIMVSPEDAKGMTIEPVAELHVKWVARKGSVPGKRIASKDLKNYTIITYKKWSPAYRTIERELRRRRRWPINIVTSDSSEAVGSALFNPYTVGTVFGIPNINAFRTFELEEIEVDIELPQSTLALCYINPPRYLSRSRLNSIVKRIFSDLEAESDAPLLVCKSTSRQDF